MKVFLVICFLFFRFFSFASKTDTVELSLLSDNVWIHTTYKDLNGYPFPSNGMMVVTEQGIILIDTPWNDAQTETLLKLVKQKFNKQIIISVITHAHDDRMGGIKILQNNKIRTIGSQLTSEFALKQHYSSPEPVVINDTIFQFGNCSLNLYYPGPGHTNDNIVVYVVNEKILYGACIFKSLESETLGNIADADLKNWDKSLMNIQKKFPKAAILIPGHGNHGGKTLLLHTLNLLKNIKKEHPK